MVGWDLGIFIIDGLLIKNLVSGLEKCGNLKGARDGKGHGFG